MADLENGLWACNASSAVNPLSTPQTSEFVVGMVKGGAAQWGIKAGDAAKGPLVKTWEGPRPHGVSAHSRGLKPHPNFHPYNTPTITNIPITV
jgi:hypothetical protein